MLALKVFSRRTAGFAALAVAILSPLPSLAQQPGNPRCVALFQNYDTMLRLYGTDDPRRGRSARPPVATAAQQLRSGGCLTFTAQLAGMALVAAKNPVSASGAPIAPPVYLHAGAVTTSADDAAAVAFFESHGLPARSIGAPLVGRRIYVGPFATQGAFDFARSLALQAGFAYPYPAQF